MEIRKGRQEDLVDVLALVAALAAYEKEPEAVTATLDMYQRSFEEKDFECLVADVDGELVGMALFYTAFSTWKGRMLYLEDFVVREDRRGAGIGTALFEAFIREAQSRKCTMIKWEVLDWNKPALRFYKRFNAHIEKHWWDGKIIF